MSKNYLKEDVNRRLEVLKSSGVSEDDMRRDVQILREWGNQQKHLPQNDLKDDLFIERMLLTNKFRIEQAKIKLDSYYTFKAVCSVFYKGASDIVPSKIPVCRVPLKNLTPDGKRILIITVQHGPKGIADFLESLKVQTLVNEIMMKYCYSLGNVIIIDFEHLKRSVFKNFDISLLHKYLRTIKSCFSARVSAIHILNVSNWGSMLLAGIKFIFKGESANKIKIHENLESLYQEIPQKSLPKNYGGEDISIEEYLEIWDDIFKEEEEFLNSLQNKIPNEDLRVGKSLLDPDIFGVDGTFRRMNID